MSLFFIYILIMDKIEDQSFNSENFMLDSMFKVKIET